MAIVKRVQYVKRLKASPQAKVRLERRLEGVREVASELGVSRMWIWQVRTGRGKSARVTAALKRYGIEIQG